MHIITGIFTFDFSVNTSKKDVLLGINKPLKDTTKKCNFTIHYLSDGRLGNIIFGYASTTGIASYNKRCVTFTQRDSILKQIFPKIKMNIQKSPSNWTSKHEKKIGIFDKSLFDLPQENIILKGYLQSFKYYSAINEHLYKEYFSQFTEDLLKPVENYKNKISKRDLHTTVCIHVRRGDYLNQIQKADGYLVASADDILFAINYTKILYKNTVFIVSSNDLDWCKKNLNRADTYFSKFSTAEQDFVLMSSCDHMIMTVGTYGWFAAWITSSRGGHVYYYKHQWVPGSRLSNQFSYSDYIPPHWIAYTKSSVKSKLTLKH